MRKTIISISLFVSIFSFAIFSHFFLINIGSVTLNKCIVMENILNNIPLDEVNDSENPIWDDLHEKSNDLNNYIYSTYPILSLFLNHERLDIMVSEIARLKEYSANGDLKESLSTISFIKSYMNTMLREDEFTFRNIF